MAVVIRLQGLRVTAGSEDIRRFFTGLKIPDGGVLIIGGEREEAFIIFASDEDARRAMTRSGGVIKGSPVTLLLSSKTEMQSYLDRSTQDEELYQKRQPEAYERHVERSPEPTFQRSETPPPQYQADWDDDDGFHLALKGLPFTVTEQQVLEFFNGLLVDDIMLLKNPNGTNNGKGLVKFSTRQDAVEGLKRHKKYIGQRYIEIDACSVKEWRRKAERKSLTQRHDSFERGRSPGHTHSNPPPRVRSRSPLAQRHNNSSKAEFCVLLENLSSTVEKKNIKELFRFADLEDDQILHLVDSFGRRTRSTFVLFKNAQDYSDAISVEKREFQDRWIYIRPISREKMISVLENPIEAGGPPEILDRMQRRASPHPGDRQDSECACLLVWNMPFDVRKVEVMDFFHGFNIREDRVFVLRDHRGSGVGKALVLFGSEAEAMRALRLSGQRFLGLEVLLKSISHSQMEELLADPRVVEDFPPQEDRSSARINEPYFIPAEPLYPDVGYHHNVHMSERVQGHSHRGFDYVPHAGRSCSPNRRGNGVYGGFNAPVLDVNGPTCVQLLNLPFLIRNEEIYDFCYGFQVIPGSLTLQYEPSGKPRGSATLVFETRQEALTAIQELSGRAIGPRRIKLMLV